ncbi:MAG TPA: hypothetical protein VFX59_10195 [Polyangiales bacterium]|nr:hypothetical protein [Polyangiales bacterium]
MDHSLLRTTLALCTLGCGAHEREPAVEAIAPRLGKVVELASLGEAGATRRRETPAAFGELTTRDGAKRPRTCVEWELLHAAHAEPTNGVEEANDELARLRCDALLWLTRARPSARSHVAWNEGITPALRAALATAPGASATWTDERCTFTDPGSTTKVVVRPIAWADLDGDGSEDLLLAVSSLDREGPMTEQRVLALTRDSDQQPLRALAL